MLPLGGWFWLAVIVLQPLCLMVFTLLVSLWDKSSSVSSGQGY